MFYKLFGRQAKKQEPPQAGPDIPFGRYSDNNKSPERVNRWTEADNLFKEKKYTASIDAFFEYLRDDAIQNVVYERNGAEGRFELYQGSKIVKGAFDDRQINAEVTLARMPQPSAPVMRRLLEMNFNLYYSRFALDEDRLCMRFDTPIESSNPSKLYYGLKELATKADKQDDLLVQDFATLQDLDKEHISPVLPQEKEVKYIFFQAWINETLDTISGLDADKFSGGIAYMLLALIYRIDYLITPEGRLLRDLEKIAGIYYKKDERPVTQKSREMIEEFRKLKDLPRGEFESSLFRSKHTFSIMAPQPYKLVIDAIHNTNLNMIWFRDNNYPYIAAKVTEYGIAFCQFSYSLPRVITELFHLYMMVNYPDFFAALGFKKIYFDPSTGQFNSLTITDKIKEIQDRWKGKYPNMDFKIQNLRFDSLVNFGYTFTTELEFLNLEPS